MKNRVAANYAKLLYEVTVNNGHRDLFTRLTNAIAQAVFLIFYHSYPRSRAKLTDTFKINVIDTCSDGFQVRGHLIHIINIGKIL